MLKNQIPNLLSSLRIILTPLYIFTYRKTIINSVEYVVPTLIVFLIICLTDVLDGKMARLLNRQTKFGQYLDVVADSLFVISSAVLLVGYKLVPLWILYLIFWKLFEFFVTSKILTKNNILVYDPIGKTGILMIFILPIFVFLLKKHVYIIRLYTYLCLILVLTSSAIRIVKCSNVDNRKLS